MIRWFDKSRRIPDLSDRETAEWCKTDPEMSALMTQRAEREKMRRFVGRTALGSECRGVVWGDGRATLIGYDSCPNDPITCDWPCEQVIRVTQWLDDERGV